MTALTTHYSDLATEVIGHSVGPYRVLKYLDRGASALVFEARTPTDECVALKIFDPAFIKKFGDEVQIKRIERQLLLKGKDINHLIQILDGGHCATTGLHFLVMPFLSTPSLDKVLDKIPRENIGLLISQVAQAAQELEDMGLCHRDIKPANIAITGEGFDNAILLDLGVIRPLGISELTDTHDKKEFVGTTRYSPPEFLLRDEEDTVDGYRAVTFYQLGGVLHDLIMRRPLFPDKDRPYARLVRAVLLEEPVVESSDVPPELVRLAKLCLLKDSSRRLQSLDWEQFSLRRHRLRSVEDLKLRAERLRSCAITGMQKGLRQADREHFHEALGRLITTIRRTCIEDKSTFPPLAVREHCRSDNSATISLDFGKSKRHGLVQPTSIFFQVVFDSSSVAFDVLLAAAIEFSGTKADVGDATFASLATSVPETELAGVCIKAAYETIVAALEELAVIVTCDAPRWINLGEA